jgi:membrane fusion protein (multidrug efflux system)
MRYILSALAAFGALAAPLFAEPTVVTGVTEPFFDVMLSSSVQGTIATQHFKEGAEVKQGDVLLDLDSRLEELELARRKEVMLRSAVDLDGTRTLFERTKAVSKDELDKKQMEAAVARAEHGIAEEQLRRRKIVAPFAGSIAEVFLQPGSSCEPYKPLLRLVDTKRVIFVGHIGGVAAGALKEGQAVKISVLGANEPVAGKLTLISPVVDAASGLAKVKAVVENADGRIRPGLAAKLIIE